MSFLQPQGNFLFGSYFMKRTLFSLTLFSLITSAGLYSEDMSQVEPALMESMELSSLEEELSALESELEDDISSLDKEILNSEPDVEIIQTSIEAPELSTKIQVREEASNAPFFSSLEEPSPISLVNNAAEEPSVAVDIQSMADPFSDDSLVMEDELTVAPTKSGIEINLFQVFAASPLIYTLLLSLSLTAIAIWLYSMSRLKYQSNLSEPMKEQLQTKLQERQFREVLALCKDKQSLLTQVIASGVSCQKHGFQTMVENMKAEGKRATVSSWQRLGLLQDIAVVAPMLGLLGTVLGMFYAFYDLNRSFESVANLFDGFGIAVGTTVAGIGVAILAMLLHSIIKFRLVQSLARVENEATALVRVLDENNEE
jgi:biopolymer transport protein ExbB